MVPISDAFWIEILQRTFASQALLTVAVFPEINAFKMEDVCLPFRHIIANEFRKEISVATVVLKIKLFVLYRAPVVFFFRRTNVF